MRVIVIDKDQEVVQDVISSLRMRWPNWEYFSTNQGMEGVELASILRTDLIILDMEINDINCLEVIREIRSISEVPIVVLSYFKDDETKLVKAIESGADSFISKPVRKLEFLSRVNALLRRIDDQKSYRYVLNRKEIVSIR